MVETAQRRKWYEFRNAANTDAGPAELLIYDEIDSWFGVSAEQLARDVAKLDDGRALNVRINSPGGNAFDGIAILNTLRNHPGPVTVYVDGLAASAASFIAMAGDEIVMSRNAELMIHNGHGLVIGDADDMRKMADNLDRVTSNIASIYAERAGGTVDDWKAAMADETWYSATEAVEAGLADRVDGPPKQRDERSQVAAKFDLSIFNHAGRKAAPPPRIPLAHNSTPQPQAEVNNEEDGHMATLKEGLAEKLGIDADADDETVLAAIDEALAERADDTATDQPPVEPTVEQATEVAAKFGLTLVNKANYDRLQADVAALNAQRAAAQLAEDVAVIDNAIKDGRIAPASRESFLNYMKADRDGARNALDSIAPNTIPVEELGHGYSNENSSIDPEMNAMFNKITGVELGIGKGA